MAGCGVKWHNSTKPRCGLLQWKSSNKLMCFFQKESCSTYANLPHHLACIWEKSLVWAIYFSIGIVQEFHSHLLFSNLLILSVLHLPIYPKFFQFSLLKSNYFRSKSIKRRIIQEFWLEKQMADGKHELDWKCNLTHSARN